ncbi:MAG: TolC family protein [Blastocatellia bacterium]
MIEVKLYKIIGASLLLSLIAAPAPSQSIVERNQATTQSRFIDPVSGVTSDDLVKRALEQNGELQAARQMIAEARGRWRQAGLKANPMIEASGMRAATSPDNNQMVGIELPLELNGRRRARVDVAAREIEMREAEVRDFERKLAAEVRMKYAEAIAAARNLKFSDDLLALTRESHRLTAARVDLGKSAPLEQNLLFVEMSRVEATRIGFESRAEVAMLELKKVLGMLPEEALLLRDELAAGWQPPSQSEVINQVLLKRPDLIAARAAESLAAAQLEQARVEGRVDAGIFANYERMSFGYGVRGFNDASVLVPVTGVFHNLTFGVKVALPTRNKNQGNIEAAAAALDAARIRREFAEKVARNEIAAAYARFNHAGQAMNLYSEKVLKNAARNLDVIRQTYEFGQKTVLDYIAEQRRYVEIETGFTDLLKEYFDARVEIERATASSDQYRER